MRSAKWVLVLSVLMILVIACGDAPNQIANNTQPASSPAVGLPAATPDELASARIHFQKNCINCHGANGEGGRKEVDGKRFKVPNLREGHALEHSDEKFVVQISEGDEEMPAFKDKLSPEDIKGLVRFIRKEFQGK